MIYEIYAQKETQKIYQPAGRVAVPANAASKNKYGSVCIKKEIKNGYIGVHKINKKKNKKCIR